MLDHLPQLVYSPAIAIKLPFFNRYIHIATELRFSQTAICNCPQHSYNAGTHQRGIMTMKTISSRDFQKNIGATLDLVNAGETVRINRYGRSQCLVIPDTQDSEEVLRYLAGKRLTRMLKAANPTQAATALTQDEINQLIHECLA